MTEHSAESVRIAAKDVGPLLTLSTLYALVGLMLDVARGGGVHWVVLDLEELQQGIDAAVSNIELHNDGSECGGTTAE